MEYEKRYKEALERAKTLYENANGMILKKWVEQVFPELKMSEGEKIMKELCEDIWTFIPHEKAHKYVNWLEKQCQVKESQISQDDERIRKAIGYAIGQSTHSDGTLINGVSSEEALAWLEKIGEHLKFCKTIQTGDRVTRNEGGVLVNMSQLDRIAKPRKMQSDLLSCDKVEPKFHEGDWVVQENIGVYKVIEVCESWYEVIDIEDNHYSIGFDKEYMCHLWSIEDAKDGDILATLDYILIFKEFLKNDGGISYCHYDFGAGNPQFIWSEDKNWYFGKKAIIHPATKEERDLLFQKMSEAGYEWDAEKKEPKKIIDEKQIKKNLQDNSFRRMFEQKSAWSEDDKKMFVNIKACLRNANKDYSREIDWLKSIKPHPKNEWSE